MKQLLACLLNDDGSCAVVLWYDRQKHHAPILIAKGKDFEAMHLSAYAKKNEIYSIKNKRLSEALYEKCDLHSAIPEEFFADVAEILAFMIKRTSWYSAFGYLIFYR